MGEEAHYVDAVPQYREKSRMPTMSRYRELIEFVKAVFSDGIITDQELAQVEKAEDDILLEYQIAAEIYDKTPDSSKRKAAAGELLMHLHRCNVLMSYAKGLAKTAHASGKDKFDMSSLNDVPYGEPTYELLEVVPIAVQRKFYDPLELDLLKTPPRIGKTLDKHILDLKLTQAQRVLMGQLRTPQLRIKANIKEMRRNLQDLTEDERQEFESAINAVLDYIERVNLESLSALEMNKILGLSKYMQIEQEHVRE